MGKNNNKIGVVTHYYSNIDVAVIKLSGSLKKGEKIRIKGHTTDFEQAVTSMQKDHEEVEKAGKDEEIGLKVKERVREQDTLYKV